jgi:predicted amidohydrolase
MTTLRVGLLQMTSGIDPAANAATLAAGIADAAAQGVQWLLTPEMTGLLDGNKARLAAHASPEQHDLSLAAAVAGAREHGLWVLLGSIPVPLADGRFANRSLLIDDQGAVVARYDKIHLFDVDLPNGERYRESASYAPGDRAVVAPTPWGGVGLTICYDVRFATLHRALAQAGATILTVPAAFTRVTGAAHWHTLLSARAIETGCFVLAPAQTGTHEDGRSTYGHSLAISPWGEVLADAGEAPGLTVVDLDLTQVDEARGRVPALRHDRQFALDPAPAGGA